MPDSSPPGLFAERPVRSEFARSTSPRRRVPYAVRRVLTVLVLTGVLGGSVYAYLRPAHPDAPQEIPTIKAEGSYRQKPAQPGGIDIPHQDIEVYQSLEAAPNAKPEVEQVLPPAETPQMAPATAKSATVNSSHSSSTTTTTLESLMAPSAPVPPVATTVADGAPVELLPPAPQAAPQPAPEPMPAPVAVPPAPVAVVADPPKAAAAMPPASPKPAATLPVTTTNPPIVIKRDLVIQVASVSDEASAHHVMADLQRHYADVLGKTPLHVVKADLGAKGVHYRVQSRPMPEERARGLCAKLKTMKAGCILVHS